MTSTTRTTQSPSLILGPAGRVSTTTAAGVSAAAVAGHALEARQVNATRPAHHRQPTAVSRRGYPCRCRSLGTQSPPAAVAKMTNSAQLDEYIRGEAGEASTKEVEDDTSQDR